MNRAQLALAFDHRPAFGREDFLVAPSNAEAMSWVDSWPEWPARAVVVYGPAGSGKSHLAQTWRLRTGARELPAAAISVDGLDVQMDAADAFVVEDVDLGRPDEKALFHFLNLLGERAKWALFTAREAPARWSAALPDLASRLRALPAIGIAPPDEGLVEAVLVKHLADRQLRVAPEVVRYVAVRLERSLGAVARIASALDTASLARQRPLTIPLARDVMRVEGFDTEDRT